MDYVIISKIKRKNSHMYVYFFLKIAFRYYYMCIILFISLWLFSNLKINISICL